MTVRYRATVAYDGSAYFGFQRQVEGTPTVQAAIERAVARVTQQTVTVVGAGRTDTGVHATGQVIAFDVNWRHADADLLRALNALLPDDIALQNLSQHAGFHPRFDASARVYEYTVIEAAHRQPLLRNRTWQIYRRLDERALSQAAALLLGEHDFATFGKPPQGDNTVRLVTRSGWQVESETYGRRLTYTVEATAFLQHMVRRMVGLMIDVGRGMETLASFEANFRRAQLAEKGSIAPPQGLVLVEVKYE